MSFILPHLSADDFFNRSAEECETWFQVFDIYIRESPDDKGILLASKIDIEEILTGILKQMRDKGLAYTGG